MRHNWARGYFVSQFIFGHLGEQIRDLKKATSKDGKFCVSSLDIRLTQNGGDMFVVACVGVPAH